MKKIIVCILFAVAATGAFAQEKGKTRLGFDIGYFNEAGLGFDINLLYNIQDNMNVGFKFRNAFMGRESLVEKKYFDALNTNFLGTYNYYFTLKSPSAIFVSGGLGLYKLKVLFHDHRERVQNYEGNKFGGFLATGIEIRKLRLALEYNLIPNSSVLIPNQCNNTQVNDEVKNSYFAITAGFFIGGGKWKR